MSNISYYNNNINKIGDEFSLTSKLADYIGNPDWRQGYLDLIRTNRISDSDTSFMWHTLSAVNDDIGAKIYEKIINYIDNISNIDTCHIHSLVSIAKMLGIDKNYNELNLSFPNEILNLLNIFSINKNLLLKSDKILTESTKTTLINELSADYNIYNVTSLKNTLILDSYNGGRYNGIYTLTSGVEETSSAIYQSNISDRIYYKTDVPYSYNILSGDSMESIWVLENTDNMIVATSLELSGPYLPSINIDFDNYDNEVLSPNIKSIYYNSHKLHKDYDDNISLSKIPYIYINSNDDYELYLNTDPLSSSKPLYYIKNIADEDNSNILYSSDINSNLVYTGLSSFILPEVITVDADSGFEAVSGNIGDEYYIDNVDYPIAIDQLHWLSSSNKYMISLSGDSNWILSGYDDTLSANILFVNNSVNLGTLNPPKIGWKTVYGEEIIPEDDFTLSYNDIDVYGNVSHNFNEEEISLDIHAPIENTTSETLIDDELYIQKIEDIFYNTIYELCNLKYREYELGIKTPTDDYPAEIWKNIIGELKSTIFRDLNSNDDDIILAKIKYKVPLSFKERYYVDQINNGSMKITDFSNIEQIIINMEIDRREKRRISRLNISRYAQYRENKVKEYFRFVILYSKIFSTTFSNYDIDSNYFNISDTSSDLIKSDNTLDTDMIRNVAKKLTDIAINASYLRESLKYQSKKTYISGTYNLLSALIKEYLYYNLYSKHNDVDNYWRLNSLNNNNNNNIINDSAHKDLDVKIVEYIDSTEYFNISSDRDYNSNILSSLELSTLNDRYWENSESDITNLAFTEDEVEQFYYDNFDMIFTSGGSYDDFMNVVFNSGATDGTYPEYLISSQETLSTSTYIMSSTEILDLLINVTTETNVTSGFATLSLTSGTLSAAFNISDNLFKEVDSVFSVPALRYWTPYSGDYVGSISVDNKNRIKLTSYNNRTENEFAAGYINLNSDTLKTALSTSKYYLCKLKWRAENVSNSSFDNASKFRLKYGNSIESFETKAGLTGSNYYTTYMIFKPSSTSSSGYITAQCMKADSSVYVKELELYEIYSAAPSSMKSSKQKAESDDGYTMSFYNIPNSNTIINTTTTTTSSEITSTTEITVIPPVLDSRYLDTLKKYIGTNEGYYPYYNYKNKVHPTYQIHPYLKGFVEYVKSTFRIDNLFNYIVGVYEADMLTNISSYLDNFGNFIDIWKNGRYDYSGYSSNFEVSNNTTKNVLEESIIIDRDGPFIQEALQEYLEDFESFTNSVRYGTGDAYNNYYEHLNLQTIERTRIADQLSLFYSDILDLAEMSIYKCTRDHNNCTLTLYKSSNVDNLKGQLWVRYPNHPISFPAFKLLQYDNESEDLHPLCQFNSYTDKKISKLYEALRPNQSITENTVFFDFDLNEYKNMLSLTYTPNRSNEIEFSTNKNNINRANILIGYLDSVYDYDLKRYVYQLNKDPKHNFESPLLKENEYDLIITNSINKWKYAGTFNTSSSIGVNFVKVNNTVGFSDNDTRTSTNNRYLAQIYTSIFDKELGVNSYITTIPLDYNIDPSNVIFYTSHSEDIMSIAFESKELNNIGNICNYVEYITNTSETGSQDHGRTTYSVLKDIGCPISIYDKFITVIDFNISSNAITFNKIRYFGKHTDSQYIPLYPSSLGKMRIWNNPVLNQYDEYKIQFLGYPVNPQNGLIWENQANELSANTIVPPVSTYEDFQSFELCSKFTTLTSPISAFEYDEFTVVDNPNDEIPLIDATQIVPSYKDIEYNFGIFEIDEDIPITIYWNDINNIINDVIFIYGEISLTLNGNSETSPILSGNLVINSSISYHIELDDLESNHVKFTIRRN